MDPYGILHLTAARHDDLVRAADESRIARLARETQEDARPEPRPEPGASGARRLRFTG